MRVYRQDSGGHLYDVETDRLLLHGTGRFCLLEDVMRLQRQLSIWKRIARVMAITSILVALSILCGCGAVPLAVPIGSAAELHLLTEGETP